MDGDGSDSDLVAIMRRLAEGDEAAVVTLYERYGGPISAAVGRVVRGRPRPVDRDDIEGLVWEVCFELASVAAAWSPDGGALPWVWARHRVANVVDRVLGPPADPLDDERLTVLQRTPAPSPVRPAAGADITMVGALDRLAPDLSSARLLAEALDRTCVSPRDRELWLAYAFEKHSGNVSPAATVAPGFGMNEASVRQAARRARQRVRRLVDSDERFAPLAELALLA